MAVLPCMKAMKTAMMNIKSVQKKELPQLSIFYLYLMRPQILNRQVNTHMRS